MPHAFHLNLYFDREHRIEILFVVFSCKSVLLYYFYSLKRNVYVLRLFKLKVFVAIRYRSIPHAVFIQTCILLERPRKRFSSLSSAAISRAFFPLSKKICLYYSVLFNRHCSQLLSKIIAPGFHEKLKSKCVILYMTCSLRSAYSLKATNEKCRPLCSRTFLDET